MNESRRSCVRMYDRSVRRACAALPAVAAVLLAVATSVGAAPASAKPDAVSRGFCFIQVSDIHIDPHPSGATVGADGRSVNTIAWVCGEAGKPQSQAPYGVTAPPPAFVIATGDLTEYGVIGQTWADFERDFASLPCPLFVVPGNHDNTWTPMYQIMRRRHHGDCYSFDRNGCHFVGLNSASPQEPVPSLDRRVLEWLHADLAKVAPGTPVFLFYHHPLTSDEFASPYEKLRLLDVLDGHNVVLMLDGHGHGVNHGTWENIDRVMGGSTFGPNTGYNVISIENNTLRVAYRYRDDKKPMAALLEKPLEPATPPLRIHIDAPSVDTASGVATSPSADGRLAIRVRANAGPHHVTNVEANIQGQGAKPKALDKAAGDWRGVIDVGAMTPGRYALIVTAKDDGGRTGQRATVFDVPPRQAPIAVRRHQHAAGFKAGALVYQGLVIIGDTAGVVTAFDRELKPVWHVETGGEVLSTPTAAGDRVVFGSGDGNVYAVAAKDGAPLWRYPARAPVYATAVVHDGIAYVGDNEGVVHAVRVADGKPVWSKNVAEYSIESAGTLVGDTLWVGAWDGFVYGVATADGTVRFKPRCPTGEVQSKSRYFGAADCPPALAGKRVFIADRGYRLGAYKPDGTFDRVLREKVSGVGASPDGRFVFARTLDDRLCKYDASGEMVWEQKVSAGRFPIAPAVQGDRVYVCSNDGLLSAFDAADSSPLWTYRVAPGLPVMAAVAVDDRGVAYVADMDGGLTAVGPRDAMAGR